MEFQPLDDEQKRFVRTLLTQQLLSERLRREDETVVIEQRWLTLRRERAAARRRLFRVLLLAAGVIGTAAGGVFLSGMVNDPSQDRGVKAAAPKEVLPVDPMREHFLFVSPSDSDDAKYVVYLRACDGVLPQHLEKRGISFTCNANGDRGTARFQKSTTPLREFSFSLPLPVRPMGGTQGMNHVLVWAPGDDADRADMLSVVIPSAEDPIFVNRDGDASFLYKDLTRRGR